MTACIVGWSHTPFGRHDALDVESLIVKVAKDAVADAGLGPDDIDEIVLGHYGGGFSPQGFTSSLVLQADEIAEAGWFAPDELPMVPPTMSIAGRMIEAWAGR